VINDLLEIAAMIPAPEKRIVIDTNVCLDLFVFHDPRWAGLLAALESGAVEAVTRADCRDEYRVVLHYAHLPLDEASRPLAAARFDALIAVVAPAQQPVRLPVCTDRDDQKFLEIARDAGAAVLISKDKALLKLARKTAQAGMFKIMLPEAWIKAAALANAADTDRGDDRAADRASDRAIDRANDHAANHANDHGAELPADPTANPGPERASKNADKTTVIA
jgi:putative PIN family toxin of toxin-antitoxin system